MLLVCYNKGTKRENNTTHTTKETHTMKYRAYNEQNYSERMGCYLATYFRTKKEAVAHAQKIGGNAKVERNVCGHWVEC
jgi:hypothetical protein